MMQDNKSKPAQNLTFKQMLDAQKNQDNIHQLYEQEIAPQVEPSRMQYFKYNASEYLRFLVDPTLIAGHIVKLGICLALVLYLSQDNVMPDLPKMKHMLESFLVLGIGFIIVTSATQSMLMPLAAIAASVVSDTAFKDLTFLAKIDPFIMQYLLATGICGICISIFFRPSINVTQ